MKRKRARWHNHTCGQCGSQFKANRRDAIYCGNICRQRARREREKRDNSMEMISQLGDMQQAHMIALFDQDPTWEEAFYQFIEAMSFDRVKELSKLLFLLPAVETVTTRQ